MEDYITFFAECVISLTGYITAIMTLRKDTKYAANRLLAAAFCSIGLFGTSIVIADVVGTPEIIHFFIRFSIIAIFCGGMFLYFTFQVIVHARSWLDRRLNTWPYVIAIIVYGIIFYSWEGWVGIQASYPAEVDTRTNPVMVAIMGVGLLLFLFMSITALYRGGIKSSSGEKRKKMWIVMVGFFLCLLAFFLYAASNLVLVGGTFLDFAFFLVLAVAMVVISYGFVGPTQK